MSFETEIQHPSAPYVPTPGTPQIMCPSCHSPQFFSERRMSGTGKILFWLGLSMCLASALLMFLGVGFCTIIPSFIVMGIGPLFRRYVNICANCKRVF